MEIRFIGERDVTLVGKDAIDLWRFQHDITYKLKRIDFIGDIEGVTLERLVIGNAFQFLRPMRTLRDASDVWTDEEVVEGIGSIPLEQINGKELAIDVCSIHHLMKLEFRNRIKAKSQFKVTLYGTHIVL